MRKDQRGFSMVELLVAMTILALIAVPVFSMLVLSAQYTAQNDLQADCLRIAENEMELQKAKGELAANGAPKCLSAADSVVADEGGFFRVDDLLIKVTAEQLSGSFHAVIVTVKPYTAEGESSDVPPVTLKGVCKYGS